MRITTFQGKVTTVDTDPKKCEEVCGFKPGDILRNEIGYTGDIRIAGIAPGHGIDVWPVAWIWHEGDTKCRADYFYNEKDGSDLRKFGFLLKRRPVETTALPK